MQVICCLINEFELKHHICLLNPETGNKELLECVTADDLGHRVATYSHEKDIHDVVLVGDSPVYLDRFVDDIYTVNTLMYNLNNEINVTVAGGEDYV